MTQVSRRTLLAAGAFGVVAASGVLRTTADATAVPGDLPDDPFTLGVCAGDPDASSAVLWTRLTAVDGAPLPAGDVVVTWELANDPDFPAPIASGDTVAAAADGHSVHVVVDVAGPSWYRFRAGAWTSPVGRTSPRPSVTRLRLAATIVPALRDRLLRGVPRHRRVGTRSRGVPRRLHLRGRITTRRRRPRADPSRRRTARPRRLPRPVRPVPRRRRSAGRAGGGAVVGDLGRPRGREQLRRARRPRTTSRSTCSAARRLAAYQAWWEHMPVRIPRPRGGCRHDHLPHDLVGHARRLHPSRRAAVPQRSGVRRRRPRPRPACPEASDPTRTMLGTVQERWLDGQLAAVGGDVAGDHPADRRHRHPPAQRRRDQLRPVGRLRPGA